MPGALHAHFVRSPHAHARIRSIDTTPARRAEGVIAIVAGRELAQWTTSPRMAPPIEGLRPVEMSTLPIDKVRFQGDPVPCVVARRPLPRRGRRRARERRLRRARCGRQHRDHALAAGAPLVDDTLPSNLVSHQHFSAGDPGRSFAASRIAWSKPRFISIARRTCRSRRAAAAPCGTQVAGTSPCISATRCRIRCARSSRRACG